MRFRNRRMLGGGGGGRSKKKRTHLSSPRLTGTSRRVHTRWSCDGSGMGRMSTGEGGEVSHARGWRSQGEASGSAGRFFSSAPTDVWTHLNALICMPVLTSHAWTGPSALLAPSTTSSRKSETAAIAGGTGRARLSSGVSELAFSSSHHQERIRTKNAGVRCIAPKPGGNELRTRRVRGENS